MTVYVVFTEASYLDPYEGRTWKSTDSVWSSKQKARDRLQQLHDAWLGKYYHPEECEECSCKCVSGHDCFYSDIVKSDEDTIVIKVDSMNEECYFIEEHVLDEAKEES